MLEGFIDRLEHCAGRFMWTDSERNGIRGYTEHGIEFCPVTAVVFAETGAIRRPEDAFDLSREVRLEPAEVDLVVYAADNFNIPGEGTKFPNQDEVRARIKKAVGLAA